jgi:hypothetical protein
VRVRERAPLTLVSAGVPQEPVVDRESPIYAVCAMEVPRVQRAPASICTAAGRVVPDGERLHRAVPEREARPAHAVGRSTPPPVSAHPDAAGAQLRVVHRGLVRRGARARVRAGPGPVPALRDHAAPDRALLPRALRLRARRRARDGARRAPRVRPGRADARGRAVHALPPGRVERGAALGARARRVRRALRHEGRHLRAGAPRRRAHAVRALVRAPALRAPDRRLLPRVHRPRRRARLRLLLRRLQLRAARERPGARLPPPPRASADGASSARRPRPRTRACRARRARWRRAS